MLFEFPRASPAPITPAEFDTPLGAIELTAAVDSQRLSGRPDAVFRIRESAHLYVWAGRAFTAELLLASFAPNHSLGERVEAAFGAVWRLHAHRELRTCRFEARWREGAVPTGGGPASGQALNALTWTDRGLEVALGAPDAEALATQEALPAAWQKFVQVPDPTSVRIEDYLADGLALSLPAIAPGEVGAVHFAVAWATRAEFPDAAWFAVDVSMPQILAGVVADV